MAFPNRIIRLTRRSLSFDRQADARLLRTGGRFYDPIFWRRRIAARGSAIEAQRLISRWAREEQQASSLGPERSASAIFVAYMEQQIRETASELATERGDLNRALDLGRQG